MKALKKSEILNTVKVTSSSVISKFGDILFDYVNSVWLAKMNGGSLWLAIYQSSEVIIGLIFNFLGGVISDLKNRKNILVICDILSGVLCLLLSIFVPNKLFLYGIIVVNGLLACLDSFRSPAYKAIFREIVEKEKIGQVNSILETCNEIIKICGPTISLVVAKFVGSKLALTVDGITFIISGIIIYQLNIIYKTPHKKKSGTTISQINEGLKYIFAHKEILSVIVFASLVNFVIAGYNLALPFANSSFNTNNAYAIFLTAESIGGLVGAAMSTFLKDRLFTLRGLFFLMFLSGISLMLINLLYYFFHLVLAAAAGIFLFNLFLSIFNIRFMTLVQTETDVEFIGRVFSVIFSVAILFMPLGTFFFQFVINLKNVNNYFIFGIILALMSLLAIIVNLIFKKKNNLK